MPLLPLCKKRVKQAGLGVDAAAIMACKLVPSLAVTLGLHGPRRTKSLCAAMRAARQGLPRHCRCWTLRGCRQRSSLTARQRWARQMKNCGQDDVILAKP